SAPPKCMQLLVLPTPPFSLTMATTGMMGLLGLGVLPTVSAGGGGLVEPVARSSIARLWTSSRRCVAPPLRRPGRDAHSPAMDVVRGERHPRGRAAIRPVIARL